MDALTSGAIGCLKHLADRHPVWFWHPDWWTCLFLCCCYLRIVGILVLFYDLPGDLSPVIRSSSSAIMAFLVPNIVDIALIF